MGKRSSRKPHPRKAANVHEVIQAQADKLRQAPAFGVRNADELPAVGALLQAGREAIEATVPASFVFCGRTYYVRARLAVQLDVYAGPGDAVPLVRGASFSTEGFGHAPGH